MPVRFTCRLIVVRTESGKLRVRYGYLGDGLRVIVVNGPRMVEPPEAEMTEEELDQWEFDITCSPEGNPTGFNLADPCPPVTAPLVEAHKTFEDEIPKGSVEWNLCWVELNSGGRTLGVEIVSRWQGVIPRFTLSAVWQNQAPQPIAGAPEGTAEIAGSDSMFVCVSGPGGADLSPGYSVLYALDPRALTSLQSRAASLSPEHHWIALRTEDHEFDRIPGSDVAGFLDQEDE